MPVPVFPMSRKLQVKRAVKVFFYNEKTKRNVAGTMHITCVQKKDRIIIF
jgi:hypothetical protein